MCCCPASTSAQPAAVVAGPAVQVFGGGERYLLTVVQVMQVGAECASRRARPSSRAAHGSNVQASTASKRVSKLAVGVCWQGGVRRGACRLCKRPPGWMAALHAVPMYAGLRCRHDLCST